MLNPDSSAKVSKYVPVTSIKHNNRKDKLSDHFYKVISTNTDLASLYEVITLDPQVPSATTKMFYKVLEEDMSEKRITILDETMHV